MLSLFFAEATATILMIQYHLTIDILAVRLTVPLVGPVGTFTSKWMRPAGRTKKKGANTTCPPPSQGERYEKTNYLFRINSKSLP